MDRPHVLIIDDDETNIDILVRLLEPLNVLSTIVLGPQYIETALQDSPLIDVVFLDLEMPVRDGYEVLADLKERYRITTPIVAYTVHASEAANAAQLGFDGFLAKPLDADQFPDQFRRILNGERVWNVRW
jgi:CheY-like chemotaxis protein